MSDLMQALTLRSYDERCERPQDRTRNKVTTALSCMGAAKRDSQVLREALKSLPRKEMW